MNKLQELQIEYKKFKEWGYDRMESAERAVDVVFRESPIKPFIYKDENGDASHLFHDKKVLFFDDSSIYSS